ncbi:MAG: carbamoyl-phosphate synthase large subunit, partial [Thermodesulfobacteriota bacterium]
DKEYQVMRDAALKIIREIGVDTGGSNIQFGVHPDNGRLVVIEMNPRVSRSSALASKATGFPIARIAAKLAVGYNLDELRNDITLKTPASFEPALDYVVVKIPRFAFEKFPQAEQTLTSQMKSVGEVMSIGRTFKESLQKALRSLEIDSYSLFDRAGQTAASMELVRQKVETPNWERLWYIAEAFRRGMEVAEAQQLSKIDPWFLDQIKQIVEFEDELQAINLREINDNSLLIEKLTQAKKTGFSDVRLGELWGVSEDEIRKIRHQRDLRVSFKTVDTCAAEFEAYTPYFYSTYEGEDESKPTDKKKIVILGSGPNRIGQGIEFDYCCVHASLVLREQGYETIMVNCNPETVSTDYDISDRLYFEPLTLEDVLNIVNGEKPQGVIVQFGGQTPLKLAVPLEKEGVKILGTSPDSIDRAEDRDRFQNLVTDLGLLKPDSGTARSYTESVAVAEAIGYPVVVRPSYVLGGRGMEIVYDRERLEVYMREAMLASPKHPVLIDRFLEAAIEIDVDAVSDGETVVIGGVMEHIEEAGIHSGDSACCLPPYSISSQTVEEICRQTRALALELKVVGLMNVQFAVQNGQIYVLEVNPRASRTVPFVSKAIGKPLAKIASLLMTGKKMREVGFTQQIKPKHLSVKESVFPFIKLPGVDTILGPEMKSTGEVMGLDYDFGRAFAKSQLAAGMDLPLTGRAFMSVKDADKPLIVAVASKLLQLGFNLIATRGTGAYLKEQGLAVEFINKVLEGPPHIVDAINQGEIDLVINTTFGAKAVADSFSIRRSALHKNVVYYTTISEAKAACAAIEAMQKGDLDVKPLQEYYEE